MESIRKELAAKEARLKDASASQRTEIEDAVAALKESLNEARQTHFDILDELRNSPSKSGGAPAKADGLAAVSPGGPAQGLAEAAPPPGSVASEPAAAGLAAVTPAQKAASDAAEQQPGQVLDRKTLDAEIAKHPPGSDQRKVLEDERDRLAKMPAKPAAQKDAPKVQKRGETFLPKTAAEYDSLPAGALYERDGKTYRKKG